jgi:hypothetical protein
MNINDIENFSPEQLASLIDSNNTAHALLVGGELDRRKSVRQHELDLKLITKQVRWLQISIITTLIGDVLGSFLTYYLTTSQYKVLLNKQSKLINQLIQEKEVRLETLADQ